MLVRFEELPRDAARTQAEKVIHAAGALDTPLCAGGLWIPEMRRQAEAICRAVAPLLPGFTVEVVPRIDSTNTELMRRARSGQTGPVLLVAQEQTEGRGRLGRSWRSGVADSVTFSLGLPLAPPDWSGLSLAVGVCLAESLHPGVGLKWPNDLWWQERKLGGILIETALPTAPAAQAAKPAPNGRRQVVIGVGINIAPPDSEGLSTPPAALRELWPDANAGNVLGRIALPLVQAVQEFEATGFTGFQARFHSRDVLQGRGVVLSDGSIGTAHGVSAAGALLVHTAAGMTAITSSEVSVRLA